MPEKSESSLQWEVVPRKELREEVKTGMRVGQATRTSSDENVERIQVGE